MTSSGPFQPYLFFPFIQHSEDHTWSPGFNSAVPYKRYMDTLEKATKMIRRVEHLIIRKCQECHDCSVFRKEGSGGCYQYINI